MIFSFRLHQELAAKQKPPDHQVGGLPLLRRRFLFSELFRRTSAGTPVPAQGTVALHCSVARLVSESFLMSRKGCLGRSRLQQDFVRHSRSGLLPHIATTESVSSCEPMKS
jgi:hypothetical protein